MPREKGVSQPSRPTHKHYDQGALPTLPRRIQGLSPSHSCKRGYLLSDKIKFHRSKTDLYAALSDEFPQCKELLTANLGLMGADPSARCKTGYIPMVYVNFGCLRINLCLRIESESPLSIKYRGCTTRCRTVSRRLSCSVSCLEISSASTQPISKPAPRSRDQSITCDHGLESKVRLEIPTWAVAPAPIPTVSSISVRSDALDNRPLAGYVLMHTISIHLFLASRSLGSNFWLS